MDFTVMGPLRVVDDGVPVPLGSAKSRCLLAALLCRPGSPVSVDVLIDELWRTTPPRTARKTLQVYVCRLRRAFGEGRRIEGDAAGYWIALRPGELDSQRFQTAVVDSRELRRAGELDRAARRLSTALGLWRGTPFGDVSGGPLIDAETVRLTEQWLLMIEERVEVDLDRGLAAELVPELESLVVAHPFRERLRAALMRALFRAGQAVRALEFYRDGQRLLREELGLEPGPELRRLHEAVLRNDTYALAVAAGYASATPPGAVFEARRRP